MLKAQTKNREIRECVIQFSILSWFDILFGMIALMKTNSETLLSKCDTTNVVFEEYQWNRQTFKMKLINYLFVRYHFGEWNESLSEWANANKWNEFALKMTAICCAILCYAVQSFSMRTQYNMYLNSPLDFVVALLSPSKIDEMNEIFMNFEAICTRHCFNNWVEFEWHGKNSSFNTTLQCTTQILLLFGWPTNFHNDLKRHKQCTNIFNQIKCKSLKLNTKETLKTYFFAPISWHFRIPNIWLVSVLRASVYIIRASHCRIQLPSYAIQFYRIIIVIKFLRQIRILLCD